MAQFVLPDFNYMNQLGTEENGNADSIRKPASAYDTIPRSMSEVSVREMANDASVPLSAVQEKRAGESSVPEQAQSKDERTVAKDKKSLKRNSLVTLGLLKGHHPTQFDEEDDHKGDQGEDDGPGAFKRPKSAYKLAR